MPVLLAVAAIVALLVAVFPLASTALLLGGAVLWVQWRLIAARRRQLAPAVRSGGGDVTPTEFESLCAAAMRQAGWAARTTKASGDQGIDVLAERAGVRVVLQCKRTGAVVGNKAVQEAFAGQSFAGAQHAAVVSNSGFSAGARALAERTGVRLLHISELRRANALFGFPHAPPPPRAARQQQVRRQVRTMRCGQAATALMAAVSLLVAVRVDVARLHPDATPVRKAAARAIVVVRSSANVRQRPSLASPVVLVAAGGTRFDVFGQAKGWTRIGFRTPVGWVADPLLLAR